MHNGGIAGWKHLKRLLGDAVGDRWYNGVQGNTDSEWAFALFLDCLEKDGQDPDDEACAKNGFGHAVLRSAMRKTIERINCFVAAIPAAKREEEGIDTISLLNFAVADGHSVVCSKYVSSKTEAAASLYFSSGTNWKFTGETGQYKMERRDKGADIVLVASEPLTFERGRLQQTPLGESVVPVSDMQLIVTDNWVTVPTNSTITIHKQTVMIHPIIDEYYNNSLAYTRSSGYAVGKGLVSNELDLVPGHLASSTLRG